MDHANPYAPPRADVGDVADPDAPQALAERSTRLAAAIVDGLIMFAMIYGPIIVAALATGAWAGTSGVSDPAVLRGVVGTSIGGGALLGLGVWLWLTIRFVLANGQSIGKKLLSIRVIRTDGSPASLARIFLLRNAATWVLSLVPLYGIVDALFIFGEPRQCLHDKLADTIVVKA